MSFIYMAVALGHRDLASAALEARSASSMVCSSSATSSSSASGLISAVARRGAAQHR